MDFFKLKNEQNETFIKLIFPAVLATCANILKKDEHKISRIAKAHLSNVESEQSDKSIKEQVLGTRIGKLLLNPFGFDFSIKS